jgi:predicted nucleotidyltransferase
VGKARSALASQLEALERAKSFVEKAKAKASSLGLTFQGAYLVGSRARGDYLRDSDIDIILVIKGVKKLNFLERLQLFTDILEPSIDLRIYDTEEWETTETTWINQLKQEAIKIDT